MTRTRLSIRDELVRVAESAGGNDVRDGLG